MPLISIQTSTKDLKDSKSFLKELSKEVAELLRKPERYVMTSLLTNLSMTFAGDETPSCYVELKSVGVISAAEAKNLSSVICKTVSVNLGIDQNRIYIQFEGVPGGLWGWDGGTFG